MATRILIKHPKTGVIKKGYFGFSWTFLFFGWFVPLFRGEILIALMHFIITIITLGIWQIIIAFLYNKQYMIRQLENGYEIHDDETLMNLARLKIGVAMPKTDTQTI